MRYLIFALVLVCSPTLHVAAQDTPPAAAELTAQEIVDRALDTNTIGFQTGEVAMTLLIQDPSGETRQRSLAIRGRNNDAGRAAAVRVTAPAAQAGQSYLFRENSEGEDDVYVFLPAIDSAPRRVSGSQKNGAFMGTHFTYADLESRDIRQANYVREANEAVGRFDTYVIQATPTDPSSTDYATVRMWVRTTDFIPLRVRFYDAAGETLKTLFTQETAEHESRTYVRRLMLSMPDGGSTTMVIESVDFDAVVEDAELTPQGLSEQ
ncbi:MAG: outer membrane lipoprotein-sorting protein [Myxococcales bacterium]|jgi:hypothetical protein|nr:outer membrane lipoprotein-sorting protein [Myxococcales bacterium]